MRPYPNKISLGRLDTPLEKCREDPHPDGVGFWVKRDDLTGVALSGNKVRKLEYLAAEALAQGATVLITCGGTQSNHARATAIVAARLGLKSHLILRGNASESREGNLFLDRLFAATITWVTPEEYAENDTVFARVVGEEEARGEKPYRIPEGGSNALGTFGYIECYRELLAQIKDENIVPEFVYTAVGSGGTLAGLLAGWAETGFEGPKPVGINVCDNAAFFVQKITGILREINQLWGVSVPDKEAIEIVDGFVGDGYALSREHELESLVAFSRKEGIVLDPVYTVKAYRGCLAHRHQAHRERRPAIFLHTGGIFGLFAKKESLRL